MSLYTFSVFAAVVEHMSFVRAADALSVTQSAVSHAIIKLEKQCGFPLFVRHKSGLKLTAEGELLLPHVSALLRSQDILAQQISEIRGLTTGLVRVGAVNSVIVSWLPDITRGFHAQRPGIRVYLEQGGYDDLVRLVKNGALDIAFVSRAVAEDMGVLSDFTPLHRDRLMLVTQPEFTPRCPGSVTVDEIRDKNFILQRDGYDADTASFLGRHGMQVSSTYRITEDSALVALVECGFGISIMPELVVRALTSRVQALPFAPCAYRTLGILAPGGRQLAPAAREFAAFATTYIREKGLYNV